LDRNVRVFVMPFCCLRHPGPSVFMGQW